MKGEKMFYLLFFPVSLSSTMGPMREMAVNAATAPYTHARVLATDGLLFIMAILSASSHYLTIRASQQKGASLQFPHLMSCVSGFQGSER
jgi:hypothetical protein